MLAGLFVMDVLFQEVVDSLARLVSEECGGRLVVCFR